MTEPSTDPRHTNSLQIQNEENWRCLVEGMPDFVLILDNDLRIRYANRPGDGLTMAEIIARIILDFLPESERERVEFLLRSVIASKRSRAYEVDYTLPNGETRTYDVLAIPRVLQGEVHGVMLQSKDITGRKHAEAALERAHAELERRVQESTAELRASEERLRAYVDHAPCGLIVADHASIILDVNPGTERLTGMARDQVIGLRVADIVPEYGHATMKKLYAELSQVGYINAEVQFLRSNDKPFWALLHGVVLDPDRYMAIFTDIGDRKAAESALQKNEVRLRMALNAAKMGVWDADIQKQECYWSEESLALFGLPSGVNRLAWDVTAKLLLPEDLLRLGNDIEETLRLPGEQISFNHIYRILRTDGTMIWVHAMGKLRRKAGPRSPSFSGIVRDITEQKLAEEMLRAALDEASQLKDRLSAENVALRERIQTVRSRAAIVGQSDSLREVLNQARQVATTDTTVLILGETGTGKELLAEAIHDWSYRQKRPFVRVACAAIPSTLLESELFGRERGAYTGALSTQIGRFETAEGGTLFLDEIGELPTEIQVKLLRVLDNHRFERLGSSKTLQANVRIIAATNRDLEEAIRQGQFREDLYHRLNVFPIVAPPLRDRPEDIPELVWSFVHDFSNRMGKTITTIDPETMQGLMQRHWAGNIRELRNTIERSMILSAGPELSIQLPRGAPPIAPTHAPETALDIVERQHILDVLEKTGWRIRGRNGAAELLGLKPTTLESRMARLSVIRPGRQR